MCKTRRFHLQHDMQQVMHNMDQLSLVSQVAVPEPHDSARRRIVFIGFGSDTTADEWIAAVDRFMKDNFANFRLIAINLFRKTVACRRWMVLSNCARPIKST